MENPASRRGAGKRSISAKRYSAAAAKHRQAAQRDQRQRGRLGDHGDAAFAVHVAVHARQVRIAERLDVGLQRLLIGHATDLEPDSAGRVLLPQKLRDYANLDKKLVLVGQSNKVEIWSEASWEARMEAWLSDDSVRELADAEEFTGLKV